MTMGYIITMLCMWIPVGFIIITLFKSLRGAKHTKTACSVAIGLAGITISGTVMASALVAKIHLLGVIS